MKVFTVAVTGGRDFNNPELIYTCLDYLKVLSESQSWGDKGELKILTGSCPTGADYLAEVWAKAREVRYEGIPAKWKKHDKAAGMIRNKMLIDEKPDLLLVCPGNNGTMDCVKKAELMSIKTVYAESLFKRILNEHNSV